MFDIQVGCLLTNAYIYSAFENYSTCCSWEEIMRRNLIIVVIGYLVPLLGGQGWSAFTRPKTTSIKHYTTKIFQPTSNYNTQHIFSLYLQGKSDILFEWGKICTTLWTSFLQINQQCMIKLSSVCFLHKLNLAIHKCKKMYISKNILTFI